MTDAKALAKLLKSLIFSGQTLYGTIRQNKLLTEGHKGTKDHVYGQATTSWRVKVLQT